MEHSDANLLVQLMQADFVAQRPDGLFITPAALHSNADFELYVGRLFDGGLRFVGLDYPVFLQLLYDSEWLEQARGQGDEIRLALKTVHFSPQRKALYRPVKVLEGGNRAEYVFEPVSIEVSYQEPVYGEPDENGSAQIVGYVNKLRSQLAKLDFDELVADVWLKGIKFGIDVQAVRQAIVSNQATRITIANHLKPAEGCDAEIIEVSPDLHRDNSPRMLSNGKADLRVFKNRFPQMTKGTRLLKKNARKLGRVGRKVTGELIEPKLPKDLDLHLLASAGTRVEQCADGEYIVAALDGFLAIDAKSNQMSITEKIENKAGVSVKTTGDLALGVDEFIEHGDVQEGRVVKGVHMTFLADVFGKLMAHNGNIRIDGCLSGGEAEASGGNITLNGRVSRSLVRAKEGDISAKSCESSTLIGRIVSIKQAVNCEIAAEEVYAESVEGCVIAAKTIKIFSTDERRGNETRVAVVAPDFSVLDRHIAKMKKAIADTLQTQAIKLHRIEQIKSTPDFMKYLTLVGQVKSGALKLTSEQMTGWRKLVEKHANETTLLKHLDAELDELDSAHKRCEEELSYAERERELMLENVACEIDNVAGQTSARVMKAGNGWERLSVMKEGEIRDFLQKNDAGWECIFSGDTGRVAWRLVQSEAE